MITLEYIELFSANQLSGNTARLYKKEIERFFSWSKMSVQNTTIKEILEYRHSLSDLHPATIA